MFHKSMPGKLCQIGMVMLLIMSGLLVACSQLNPTAKPDQVSIKFNWLHEAEWAGFYAAQKQGYYADENLEVTLIPGEIDYFDEVLSGEIDFGVCTGTGLVLARAEGKPVTAISALLRQSPLIVLALADSGITQPQDLVGRTVSVMSPDLDTGWDIQFLALLKEVGVDEGQVNMVPMEEYGIGPLVRGETEALGYAWSVSEGVEAKVAGQEVNMIFMSDYNVLEYPNAIFTTEQMIQERPDVVERFVRATLKGHQYAIEHPEESAQLALEYDDSLDPEWLTAQMPAYVPLIDTGDAPLGWMDAEVWQSTQDILLDQGFISSPADLSDLYTNSFVEKAQ